MAEIVGYRQELLLPAYEELRRSKLATEPEIRDIKKRRDELEYKLTRKEKTIKTFGEYIVYEKHLLKLLQKREKKYRSAAHEKQMESIENFIKNHVKSLFKQALQIFYTELRLWESYIKTLMEFENFVEVSSSYEKMLQHHSDKPQVWLDAIEWEGRDYGNMSKVRRLLLRAIQKHPTNADIHAAFFKILLIEAERMSTDLVLENNTASERDVGLRRIEVIYTNSKQKINDLNYLVKVLHYLEKYPFTKRIQRLVLNDMMTSFPRSEETWHEFALRELHGFSIADALNEKDDVEENKTNSSSIIKSVTALSVGDDEVEAIEEDGSKAKPGPSRMIIDEEIDVKPDLEPVQPRITRTLKRRIELCCDVYDTAVKTLKTVTMWELYIQTMLDINRDTSTQKSLKRQKLYNAFVGAYQADSLSEKHFELYVNLLRKTKTKNEVIEEVMKKATKLYPYSKDLWKLRMECCAIQDDPIKIYDIFTEGIKLVEKNGYELWKVLIRYYLTRSDLNYKINQIYNEAIKVTDIEEFLEFRVQYLEWTLLTENIERTRQLYDEMTGLIPKYYQLHEKMALFESNQLEPNIDRWRKCYENMIHYFGEDHTDVWINYIKFERDDGNCKNMSVLHERAKKTLNPSLYGKFLSEYTFLSTGLL